MSLLDSLKKAEGAAVGGSLIGPALPWLACAAGLVLLGLLSTIGFYHYVRVPELINARDAALLDTKLANHQTEITKESVAALQAELAARNACVEAQAVACATKSAAADQAGRDALKRLHSRAPLPPKDLSAESVSTYWNDLTEISR
jgi:hypothetical protein